MIPSIEEILRAVANGSMSFEDALKYIDAHMEAASSRHEDYELRDGFAGMAMQGELAAQNESTGFYTGKDSFDGLASYAYQIADAMLRARKA